MVQKKITIEYLARTMKDGFEKAEKRTDEKIDGLAVMVQHGFESVDKRLDGMDVRFDGIDKRLDGMDVRFDGIDKRLDGLDKRLDGFGDKLDSLERRIMAIEDILTEYGKLLRRHEEDLRWIRKELGEIKKNQKDDRSRIIDLERRVVRLEGKMFA